MKKMFLVFLLLFVFEPLYPQILVVVTNPNTDIDKIDRQELINVYSLKTTKINDTGVMLLDIKYDSEARNKFYSYMGTSTKAVKKVWLREKLSGNASPPTLLLSFEEIKKLVSERENYIGYIPLSLADKSVKIIHRIP